MSTLSESEKKILFPERQVAIGGRTFTIKPFSFRQTFVVMDKFREVITLLVAGGETVTTEVIISTIMSSGEKVAEIISMVVGEDKDLILDLDNNSIVTLLDEIVKANMSFFENLVAKLPSVKRPTT